MEQKRIRESILVAGLEQTGKTYYIERLANQYAKSGRAVIAYNVGKPTDFSDFQEINIVTPLEMMASMGKEEARQFRMLPKIEYFRHKGKVYHFSKFREMFEGNGAKVYRIDNRYERYLYQCFFEHVFDTLIIFDDNRAQTRHGMGHEMTQLISRKNHCGSLHTETSYGNDLVFIYHNMDTPPKELWDYITRAILFRLNRIPENFLKNPEFMSAINWSYEKLKEMPKYSKVEILLRNVDRVKVIPRPHH